MSGSRDGGPISGMGSTMAATRAHGRLRSARCRLLRVDRGLARRLLRKRRLARVERLQLLDPVVPRHLERHLPLPPRQLRFRQPRRDLQAQQRRPLPRPRRLHLHLHAIPPSQGVLSSPPAHRPALGRLLVTETPYSSRTKATLFQCRAITTGLYAREFISVHPSAPAPFARRRRSGYSDSR
jgi:hypothetical protein